MINIGDYNDQELWCGVFQGGGARGAAYPGALLALHARHQWFTAVAGSSAGAITAALVAACLDPDDIVKETPRLLATIQPDGPVDRIVHTLGWRHAVRYDSTALEAALDQLLRRAIEPHPSTDDGAIKDGSGGDPVTFAELFDATQVRLYVIVGDASTGVPIPFCVETTPHLSVAAAVVASCAIPVVFAPRYAAVDTATFGGLGGPVLRRLQDGGLWANFPAFTFTDQAFRSYHGLVPGLTGRVLGFTLMYNLTLPTRIDRFVDVPHRDRTLAHTLSVPPDPHTQAVRPRTAVLTAARRSLLPVICLLSAVLLLLVDPTRPELLLPAAVLLLVGVVGVGTLSWRLVNLIIPTTPVALGGLFAGYAWVLATTRPGNPIVAVIVAVVALGLIMTGWMLHRVLERTTVGLHGLVTIITGQTIRPAPWVDQLPGSHLVYVQTGDLDMLSFDAADHTIHQAVHAAHSSCSIQLDRILTGQPNDILSRVIAAAPTNHQQ